MLGLGEEKKFHQGEIGAHDKTKGQKRGSDSFLQYFLPLGHFFTYINSSLLHKIRKKKGPMVSIVWKSESEIL